MIREKFSRLQDALTMAYIKVRYKINEFRRDEDAMEVIQVVMLIAVGVIAIAAVWAATNGLLGDLWGIITEHSSPAEADTYY